MKIKKKIKDCYLIVRVKMTAYESINKKELDRFSRLNMSVFLRPKLIRNDKIEFSGPVAISLYERLQRPITKNDFFIILEYIMVAVQILAAKNFPLSNLIMDIHNTYINETTKEIKFLYVPGANIGSSLNLVDFINEIIYSSRLAIEEDMNYVYRFNSFFRTLKPSDIDKIEQYIADEDRNIVSIIKKQNVSTSGFMTDKQKHYYDYYERKKKLPDDEEATGLLEENYDLTARLNENNENDEATKLLEDNDYDEGTALLESEVNSYKRFPTLFRISSKETITVNKAVFRLGKGRGHADYCITDNNTVSGSHADIVTRKSKYFIIDLNSLNHTFVNGQVVPPQCETEIYNGDRLKLSNEEFIFNVE